ncbi:hypothetical protein DL769_010323 [Monosporascus sp. CRB-8-3]|nr:hypothetical protein DL769_010323 [Monosporascus sp. CRB-8-3]
MPTELSDIGQMQPLEQDAGSLLGLERSRSVVMKRSKLYTMRNEGLSDLLPCCAAAFVGTCYLAGKFLLETVYGSAYRRLSVADQTYGRYRRRRDYVAHHLAVVSQDAAA